MVNEASKCGDSLMNLGEGGEYAYKDVSAGMIGEGVSGDDFPQKE